MTTVDVPLERLARAKTNTGPEVPARPIDVAALAAELSRSVDAEVRFDEPSRGLYAQDASNYYYPPIGVVVPRTRDALVRTVAVCRDHRAPITCRAGGTALAGQSANAAVIIDVSKYLRTVLEIDLERRLARVEPGVVCDHLVDRITPHHLTFGPKPATHNRCCFGGMLANNCGGMQAQMNGTAVDQVEEMEVLLYDGTVMKVGWMTEDDLARAVDRAGTEGRVYRELRALRDRYADLVRARYPKIPRRVSGYNLDELLPKEDGRFNVARALVGSEGTCVTFLEATVRLIHAPPERVVVCVGYEDLYAAADRVPDVLPFEPLAVEGMDDILRKHVQKKGGEHAKHLDELPRGNGWLFVELGAESCDEAREVGNRVADHLRSLDHAPVDVKVITDREEQKKLWDVREAGLGATAFVPGEPDTWPGWEDSAVAPEKLGAYLRDLRALFDAYDMHPSLYGHFGMGCVHCRIDFDLYSEEGVRRFRAFLDDAADLVVRYGGSLSGEHGDGQARARLLEKMFGPELVEAFRAFKRIWDPDGKMNPGRIVDTPPITANLRLGGDYHPWEPETYFAFEEDHGSFAHATLRCVGVGKCRRTSGEGTGDVMCPSYMVTHEEMHSTRGRAHLLWEMTRNGSNWKDEGAKEALDLCLACKGCRGECPVNVDVATYKAEFLAHWYEGKLRPRSAYAFGLIDKWARLGSRVAGLANLFTQTPGLARVAKLVAGIAPSRAIPAFAPETFRAWFRRRGPSATGGEKVLLWPDTFNEHFHPETARAAVEVLEHCGFDVVVPERTMCCGRPLYDYGMLHLAKKYLEDVLDGLAPHIEAKTPIVVLEPSCASVFKDEMTALLPHREDAKRLRDQVVLLSELLHERKVALPSKLAGRRAVVQGHCHHKSTLSFEPEQEVMRDMGLAAELLDSGCCGMAGSFGFEDDAKKQEVSHACGERVLLPAVRDEAEDTVVIADGFSCRTQIAQGTDRHALHLAEVLKLAIDGAPPSGRPEAPVVERRRSELRRASRRALAGTAIALTVAGIGAVAAMRLRHGGWS